MNRRELLKRTAALGVAAGIPSLLAGKLFAGTDGVQAKGAIGKTKPVSNPLTPPAEGSIPVAFPISEGAVIIDFCGPWEVFQDVQLHGRKDSPFHLYTVAETKDPIIASGGMKITPEHTFQTAPVPKVIVIPAQKANEAMLEWIRTSTKRTDVTMSVCTGAYVLAKTGLLSGKSATTFHMAYEDFAVEFPDIHLKRGARFVEDGNLASSGGLSSGMDLAFRVVERYFGRDVAEETAYNIEYQGRGWTNPDSNMVYTKPRRFTADKRLCPVCGMDGDPTITSFYEGKTYLFCMRDHKEAFEKAPARFVSAAQGQ
ncbi:MAG TPA: DJ-1/PfpI family protein [Candidatus Polarisedimenticolia bacterium]|nr:DJ-1/PfpI family protein [Candidatus Polarisedimenticolia bacterium]